MNGKDTNENTQTFEVVVTRILDAPLDEVWKAWSDPEYVMRWWGPTGFTSPSAEMDFRVGGASLVCMRAPEEYGGKDGNHLDPGAMGMPPGVPHDVPHEIVFNAAGEGRTEMVVTEYGYTTEQARDLSRAGMEQCLDKMAAIFAG